MLKFKIETKRTIELTEEDINDILSVCFSGGCGYWACIDNTTEVWDKARDYLLNHGNTDPTVEDIMTWILCNGHEIIVIDREENEQYSLTLWKFFDGIKLTVEHNFWDGEDVYDIDGEVGDVIIQYAVFNELVYG